MTTTANDILVKLLVAKCKALGNKEFFKKFCDAHDDAGVTMIDPREFISTTHPVIDKELDDFIDDGLSRLYAQALDHFAEGIDIDTFCRRVTRHVTSPNAGYIPPSVLETLLYD